MPSKKPAYSVHPAVAYAQTVIANLPKKTGRSLADWVQLVQSEGLGDAKEIRLWLKSKHKVGATTASMIADQSLGNGREMTDPRTYLRTAPNYVAQMYAGPKQALFEIHEKLLELGRSLGDDVRVCPCKTIVPLYREHVFAEIKPATQTRIDFGLALRHRSGKIPKRLIDTGGLKKGDRITHRFALSQVGEVDKTVEKWTAIAYELDE